MSGLCTIDVPTAAATIWDVAVIGGGPAGALAAHQLARRGLRTLVIERASLPRWKVCGACLNQPALETLWRAGLEPMLTSLPNAPLVELLLFCRGSTASVPLGPGRVVSRARFDAALLTAAIEQGASLLTGFVARLGPVGRDYRELFLGNDKSSPVVKARAIVIAAGLGGEGLLRRQPSAAAARPSSRVGIGCVDSTCRAFYEPGRIYMAVGDGGYIGLVRQEDGSLNVAAAIDRSAIRQSGSPAAVVGELLRSARLPAGGLSRARWRGTAALEREPDRLGDTRVFLVGDSAGYVEPFTGEGIAWALEGAVRLAPIAAKAISRWDDSLLDEWQNEYRRALASRHRVCSLVAAALRRTSWVAAATRLLAAFPALSRPLVRYLGNQTLAPTRTT